MLYQIVLKIKSRIVSNTWDDIRKMFVFPREQGGWGLDRKTKDAMNLLLRNAVTSLGLSIDADTIRWPSVIALPSLILHDRPKKGKQREIINHEAINKGVLLTFLLMVRTEGQEREACPDEKILHEIFQFIGTYEGISPFGSSVGLGLFDVKSVDLVGRGPANSGELPEGSKKAVDVPR